MHVPRRLTVRQIPTAVVLATACVFFQGCFSIDVTVKLNADGSGLGSDGGD
jgi:hypothetical protein